MMGRRDINQDQLVSEVYWTPYEDESSGQLSVGVLIAAKQ
jgi:hypothetical protein